MRPALITLTLSSLLALGSVAQAAHKWGLKIGRAHV